MTVHAGMLRATRTGATNICREKARDLLNDVLQYVVRNKCLFCIAVSDHQTFSKNENSRMTINSPSW